MHDFFTLCAQAEAVTMRELNRQLGTAKRNLKRSSTPFYLPKAELAGKALRTALMTTGERCQRCFQM